MKRNHFLLAASIISLTACSTYRQTQTPDDVYYSPGTEQEGVASNSNSNSPNNGEYYSTPNDQYIRLKAQDPNKWSYFDDYSTDYYGGYAPYGSYSAMAYGASAFGYYGSMGWGMSPWIGFSYWSPMTYWNSYYTWNGFYNPYYGGIIVTNPKVGTGTVTRLNTFNPSSYTNTGLNKSNRPSSNAYNPYDYSQTIRRSYTNTNGFNTNSQRPTYYRPSTNNNNTFTNQNRTYSPRTSTSSFGGSSGGGGSRGGGGGGMSRPGR